MAGLGPGTTLTLSADAWKLLHGLVCLYKPAGVDQFSVLNWAKFNLSNNLNRMERTVTPGQGLLAPSQVPLSPGSQPATQLHTGEAGFTSSARQLAQTGHTGVSVYTASHLGVPVSTSSQYGQPVSTASQLGVPVSTASQYGQPVSTASQPGSLQAATDYSVHPLVLGPAYDRTDFNIMPVNKLDNKVSGVVLVGMNRGVSLARRLRNAKLLSTFQVDAEFGRATTSGWTDGKTAMKATWRQLANRPWLIEQVLASVMSGHQKAAWQVANCDPATQEGYERALLGPPRPSELSETLVYGIRFNHWAPPHFGLEVQCVSPVLAEGDQQLFVLELVQEVAARVRTVCAVSSLRCTSLGPWGLEAALLRKHWNLQHVVQNIGENRRLVKQVWGGEQGVRKEQSFSAEVRKTREEGGGGQRAGGFTEQLLKSTSVDLHKSAS